MNALVELTLSLPVDTFQALERASVRERKTASDVALEAIRTYLGQLDVNEPLIGLFVDEPQLVDEITETAMQLRETSPWREPE